MQVDAYAAKVGLRGLPKEDVPSLKQAMIDGWPFIFVLGFLFWGLLFMRWERLAPWYASGLMIVLSFYRKETRYNLRKVVDALVTIGDLVTRTTAIIIPIGFIYAGLSITGVTLSFTAGLISVGGHNVFLMLLMGFAACYIMGMAGMVTPAYIFLAVTLAPAVLKIMDLNVLAIHLFIVYYSCLAPITLPVADAAFVGAAIAGANPIKTGLKAMQLGSVIYFVPFFFVFNPALILEGPILSSLFWFPVALLGLTLLAAGFEGYLWGVGRLKLWPRPLLSMAGLLIAFPEWRTTVGGIILAALVVGSLWLVESKKKARARSSLVK